MHDITLKGGVLAGESYWTSRTATWPFGLLTVSPAQISVAARGLVIRFRYDFPKQAIQKLVVRQYNLLPGFAIANLRITHNVSDVPRYIRFGTFDPDTLRATLTSAGYEPSTA